jgi:uncharacterized protein YecE (DUF72 family)
MRENTWVGPAGWSYEDWRGIVYPASKQRGFHEASYLTNFFSTIEINTSFYRPLKQELTRVWAQRVEHNPRFRFTAKMYRGFTHDGRMDRESIREFCQGLTPLIEHRRLGCLLMQFPFSFRFNRENRDYLLKLKRAFSHFALVAEMRHASWNCEEGLGVLIDNQIGFCNIDQPQLHQCMPPTAHVTSVIGYVRLHGRNYLEWFNHSGTGENRGGLSHVQARYNYLYTISQLEKWKKRVGQVADQTKATYVVANNHFQGKAVVNALQILSMLTEEKVEVPEDLMPFYPELLAIAQNTPAQRSLFEETPVRTVGRSREAHGEAPALMVVAAGGRK